MAGLAPTQVVGFVREGIYTGASGRNWTAYGKHITLNVAGDEARALLTDPQTSGGLLVSCAPDSVDDVFSIFRADGFTDAAVISAK